MQGCNLAVQHDIMNQPTTAANFQSTKRHLRSLKLDIADSDTRVLSATSFLTQSSALHHHHLSKSSTAAALAAAAALGGNINSSSSSHHSHGHHGHSHSTHHFTSSITSSGGISSSSTSSSSSSCGHSGCTGGHHHAQQMHGIGGSFENYGLSLDIPLPSRAETEQLVLKVLESSCPEALSDVISALRLNSVG
jgi:hypothetical protein